MKTKILKFSLLTAVLGVALWSCKKDVTENPNPINTEANLSEKLNFLQAVPSSANSSEAGPGIRVRITWEEWGRARRSCRGWGLCEFTFEIEPFWVMANNSSNVTHIEGNNYISQILLANPASDDIDMNDHPLIIDYDITKEIDIDGNIETFILKADEYVFMEDIGEFGGYQVNIIKL